MRPVFWGINKIEFIVAFGISIAFFVHLLGTPDFLIGQAHGLFQNAESLLHSGSNYVANHGVGYPTTLPIISWLLVPSTFTLFNLFAVLLFFGTITFSIAQIQRWIDHWKPSGHKFNYYIVFSLSILMFGTSVLYDAKTGGLFVVSFFLHFISFHFWKYSTAGKAVIVGLLAIALNPITCWVVGFYFWNRQWKMAWGIVVGLVILLAAPALWLGMYGNLIEIKLWFQLVTSQALDPLSNPASILGWLNIKFQKVCGVSLGILLPLLVLFAVIASFTVYWLKFKRFGYNPTLESWIGAWALVSLFSVYHLDHLIFMMPICIWIFVHVHLWKSKAIVWLLMSCCILPFLWSWSPLLLIGHGFHYLQNSFVIAAQFLLFLLFVYVLNELVVKAKS